MFRTHARGRWATVLAVVATATMALTAAPSTASTVPEQGRPTAHARVLTSGLGSSLGSTVGPDGMLYVPDALSGTVWRVNPRTGASHVVGRGLPARVAGVPLGGAMDVAFLHGRLYALVTMVSADLGGTSADGVYRVGRHHSSLVADIGAYTLAHPPATDFFVPSGLQYSLLAYHNAFLVSDGHHNRVYRATRRGRVTEVVTLVNVVPTALATRHGRVYLTLAGPAPHLPRTGRLVRLHLRSHTATAVVSGARLAVGVAFGRHARYLLSQGYFVPGHEEGSPAEPSTGTLFRVTRHGHLRPVVGRLDLPTTVEVIGRRAYVVTLTGDVYRVRLGGRQG